MASDHDQYAIICSHLCKALEHVNVLEVLQLWCFPRRTFAVLNFVRRFERHVIQDGLMIEQ